MRDSTHGSGDPAQFLILEDDSPLAGSLARLVRGYGLSHVAPTVHAARDLLARSSGWRAFLLDVALPDGNGLEFLRAARADHAAVPALVLTGHVDDYVVNATFDLQPACVVAKPWDAQRMRAFLESVTVQAAHDGDAPLQTFVAQYHLPASEADILRRLMADESIEEIAQSRGTSPLTVRKQIAVMRSRTGDESIRSLIIHALGHGSATRPRHTVCSTSGLSTGTLVAASSANLRTSREELTPRCEPDAIPRASRYYARGIANDRFDAHYATA